MIHAGIYYEPGSDMAKLCVDGARMMYEYCEKKKLPHKRVGKLIVATRESELPILEELYHRATANGVQGLELLSPKQIIDLEPNVRALRALHSPNTGIVDYAKVGRSYAEDVLATGRGQIRTGYAFSTRPQFRQWQKMGFWSREVFSTAACDESDQMTKIWQRTTEPISVQITLLSCKCHVIMEMEGMMMD